MKKQTAVQQDGGIPTPVALVVNALDHVQEFKVLVLKLGMKLLGDPFDVERFLDAVGHFHQRDVSGHVEVIDVEDHRVEFAQEETVRLAPDIDMIAGGRPAVLPLDPILQVLRAAPIDEDEKLLVVQRGYFLVQGRVGLGVRHLAVLSRYLQNHDAGQMSELPPREGGVFVRHGDGLTGSGL